MFLSLLSSCGSGIDLKTPNVNYSGGPSDTGTSNSAAATCASVAAQVAESSTPQNTILLNDRIAQSFTSQLTVNATSIELKAARGTSVDTAFTVSIHRTGGLNPDSQSAIASGSGTLTSSSSSKIVIKLSSPALLERNAMYWIVVTIQANRATQWFGTNFDSYSNGVGQVAIGGGSWAAFGQPSTGSDFYFVVNPCTVSAVH